MPCYDPRDSDLQKLKGQWLCQALYLLDIEQIAGIKGTAICGENLLQWYRDHLNIDTLYEQNHIFKQLFNPEDIQDSIKRKDYAIARIKEIDMFLNSN